MADAQLVGAGEGALSGAAAGSIFGPIGAGVGAVAGGTLGYLSSSQKGYSLPTDLYSQRLQQIASYSNQLRGATDQYATAIGNMYNTAYNQYLPDAAATFAGKGLGIDSGAFGAELARTAAKFTSEDLTNVAGMNINSIDKVNKQYGDAWSDMFGANVGSNKSGFDQGNANVAGLLGTAAGLARIGLNKGTPNPMSGSTISYTSATSDFNPRNPWAGESEGFGK